MNEQEALELLNRFGAILKDSHFVYANDMHGSVYVNKDAVYLHPSETSRLNRALAWRFEEERVKVVIGPAVGGALLAQWTAYHLNQMKMDSSAVLSAYADKERIEGVDQFFIRRGYDKILVGKRVLVVEDVLHTGNTAKKVVQAVRDAGGIVVGVGALYNRGDVSAKNLDVPTVIALVNKRFDAWNAADCPLCIQGIPIDVEFGKGREFLGRQA